MPNDKERPRVLWITPQLLATINPVVTNVHLLRDLVGNFDSVNSTWNLTLTGAIVADYAWFLESNGLDQWLKDHNVQLKGLILIFPDQQTANWFSMRWL